MPGFPSLSFQSSQSASSEAKSSGDIGDARNAAEIGSAGHRGFINNFAAEGAKVNADQGLTPTGSSTWPWLIGAAAVVVGAYFLRRKG